MRGTGGLGGAGGLGGTPRTLLTAALAVVLTLTVVTPSWAFWTPGSQVGGNGSAAAAVVGAGATPTASGIGSSVTVSWAAATLSTGQAVGGYEVRRYDAGTSVQQTTLTGCAGTVTATTCTETGLPTGSWRYSVTPLFATSWRGAESARSTTVVTDATPPTSTVTVTGVTGGASRTGGTVYYRGSAAGSFTLTNSLVDAATGPASSQTAALTGSTTGWTHTPSTVSTPAGGPYVSTPFSWAAGTTTGPGVQVTGRDVAGNATTTSLTFADDSVAPTGSVGYQDGYTTARRVTVTLAVTDAGSGVSAATGVLQRASAPLSGGVCGSSTAYATVATSPTSPYVDTSVANSTCYTYRYTVQDAVGNAAILTGSSVAKVDYAGAIAASTGLLSHWRFGEQPAASDTFTDTAGTLLSAHTSQTGATWVLRPGGTTTVQVSASGTARRGAGGRVSYYSATLPNSADYTVQADVVVKTLVTDDLIGVAGRYNPAASGDGTSYLASYLVSAGQWRIYRIVNGGYTLLGSFAQTLAVSQSYRVVLGMSGSAITLSVDGVQRIAVTDTAVTAAGRAAVALQNPAVAGSDTTGLHLDNVAVTPAPPADVVDSKGTNTGDYAGGVRLGYAGALPGDSNTAATFDGANDSMRTRTTTGVPAGSAVRSVETWFRTPGVAAGQTRQALFVYGTGSATQAFGVWLEGNGTSIKSWGGDAASDRTQTWTTRFDDNAWHHFVVTWDGTSIRMYVDGVLGAGTQTTTRNTVIDASAFTAGAVPTGGLASSSHFNGSLDEMAVYTTVLTPAVVAEHHDFATVVTGGP